jgi:hypothetical protein
MRSKTLSRLAAVAATTTLAGLVVPLVGATAASAAAGGGTAVTNLSVQPSPNTTGANASYNINFTTSSSGALSPTATPADTIKVTFPTGTTLPAAASNYIVNGVQATTVVNAGTTETITTPVAVGNSSPVQLVINNATNPAAGSYSAQLSTSQDQVPVNSNSYTIGAAATSPTLSGPTLTNSAAGATSNYNAIQLTASSTGALAANSSTITLTGPTGTVFPLAASDYTVDNGSGAIASTVMPTQTATNNVTFTTPVAVANNGTATIVAANVKNPTTTGTYHLQANTSSDTAPTTSSTPYSISAATTSVTNVSGPNPTPNTAGSATSRYTVGFTPTTAVPVGGTITLTGPTGTVFQANSADYTVNNQAVATAANGTTTNIVTLTVATALPAGSPVSVVAINVTNPGASTTDTLQVRTSTDTTDASTPTYTITAASTATAPALVTVTGPNPNNSGAQAQYGIVVKTTTALPAGGTITFVAPAGTVFPLTPSSYTVNGVATTANPTQTASNNVTITSPVAVGAGATANVVAINVTNPSGGFYTLTAATSTDTSPTTSNQYTVSVTQGTTGQFVPVTPNRLLDSTTTNNGLAGNGYTSGPLQANKAYTFDLKSHGVPATATAVALNVTAVHPDHTGYLGVSGNGGAAAAQATSLINYLPFKDTANAAVIAVDTSNGVLTLYTNSANTNVDIDLTGYYTTLAAFNSAGVTRVGDTRTSGGPIPAGTFKTFTVNAPVGSKAVALNVTSVHQNVGGYLAVVAHGAAAPTSSNVNYLPGVDKAGFAIVNLPADGSNKVDVYAVGGADNVALDEFGYYPTTANLVTKATPTRVLDTRSTPNQGLSHPLAAGVPATFSVTGSGSGVPADAQAVVISLTSAHNAASTGVGNLAVYPAGGTQPLVSTLNYISPGRDVANLAIVKLGPNGTLTLLSSGSPIDVAVDVLGYVPAGS